MSLSCFVLMAAGCRTDPARLRGILLNAARQELAAGQPARAAVRLKRILQMDGRDAEANYELGRALLAQGDPFNAAMRFRRAAESNPDHDGAQIELARLIASSRDGQAVEEARQRLQRILSRRPGNPDVLGALGLLEWRAGELGAAETHLEQATLARPLAGREVVALAHVREQAGRPAAAETILRRHAATAGAGWPARLALAEYLRAHGRRAEAEAEYRRASAEAPDEAAPAVALAELLSQLGRNGEAATRWQALSRRSEPAYHALYANHLTRLGRHEAALAELAGQCRRFPRDRQLWRLRYQEMRLQRRTAELNGLLEDALRRSPNDTDARLERARLHAQSSRWQEAAADADAVLRYHPANATALYIRSKTYQHQRRHAERKQALAAAVDADPQLLPARLELAALVTADSPRAALELLERAPAPQTASPAWQLERNWILLRSGEWNRLERELARGPAPAGWNGFAVQRGLLALARRDYSAAQAAVSSLLREQPGDLVALDVAVRALAGQRKLDEALELIARQAAGAGQPAGLYDFQARFLLSLGRRQEGRQALERCGRVAPDFAPAQILLAQMETEDGRPAAASARLERTARLAPQRVELWLAWGDALVRRGQVAAALATYKKALELQPDNPLALNNIAHLTAEALGRPDDALPYALKARETGAGIAAVNHTLGWILCRRGMWSAALPHLEQSRAQRAEPQVTYRLAIAYAMTGNKGKGRRMYEEASRQNPALPEAREALAALNRAH